MLGGAKFIDTVEKREYFVRVWALICWPSWCVFPKSAGLFPVGTGGGIPRLRWTFWRDRWTIGAQADELFQVLNRCGEQELIFGASQAAQS